MWLIIPIIIVITIIFFLVVKSVKVRKINNFILSLCNSNNYSLKSFSKEYNYILENENEIIYLRYIFIPKNSSITVNSKSTWCLRYGGGSRNGRSYPNKEYLNYLKPFLTKEYIHENKKVRKVVVLYPTTEVILKYINESDIININQSDLVYGTQIIKFNELEKYLFI